MVLPNITRKSGSSMTMQETTLIASNVLQVSILLKKEDQRNLATFSLPSSLNS